MKKIILLPLGLAFLLCSCNSGKSSSTSSSTSTTTSSSTSTTTSSSTSTSVPATGFNVAFNVDEHVTLTVYTTKNYDVVDTDQNIQTRNGDTGEYCSNGEDSQVNFKLIAEDGYEVETVTCTSGTYNKIKWPADTLVENGYRVTKITANTTITVTSKSKQADPEGYKVSFVLEHCSVQVHIGKDTSTTDTPDGKGNYFTRDKDTGEYTKNTDNAQMNFTIIPEAGYEFVSGVEPGSETKAENIDFITGDYNKLKNNDNNYYTVTKVKSELIITLACTLLKE